MVTFVAQTTGYAVCDACQSMLVRQNMEVSRIGQSAALQEDGTPLMLGSAGAYQKVPFEIIGRIQVQYSFGFWNEWFCLYANGNQGWLGESQGNYFANFQTQVAERLPAFEDLRRGNNIPLNGRLFCVTQKQKAQVIGCEGELPFIMHSGYKAPLVDLKTETVVGATIDYSEDTPLVFIGETVDFDALGFSNLREIEAWS
ncbi:MAG: DUF4178 domain-containing protein [Armatimonadetes bacterium]|nr:DUF4178 domain-containing protein [Armatimonadota bacterium]